MRDWGGVTIYYSLPEALSKEVQKLSYTALSVLSQLPATKQIAFS